MLNENQLAASQHLHGPMMVLAGPGSGKTAVITARAAFLTGQNPGGILVITYSKAAANEMLRRYETMCPGDKSVTFGTFHSTFFRILRRKNNFETGQILSDQERRMAVKNALSELQYEPDDEMLAALLTEMSLVRNELHDLKSYQAKSIKPEDFAFLCESYEQYKHEKNKIDFDDMLCRTYAILKSDENTLNYWRKKYPFILIDEFQDINRVQYEAVKLLAAPKNNIFVVGDDDQSIYRFRGSRPEFLLNFPTDFPNTNKITLKTNYRSTDAIINYANNLISANKMRYDKNITGTKKKGPSPFFITAEDQQEEAVQIAEKIRKILAKGANPAEIAIAFRLNMQARAFMDAFLNMHIPFRCRDEVPTLYEHWIAEDIFAYLRVAQRLTLRQKTGYDPDAAHIINKPFRYIGKAFLHGAKKSDKNIFKVYKKDPALHLATKTGIEELQKNLLLMGKMDTSDAIRFIRKNMNYDGHLISTCEYRKLNHVGLFEIADELQDAAKQFSNPPDFIAHAKKVAKAAKEGTSSDDCCTLTTLHSAKGLEFERVFIAGVVEEVLPYVRSKTADEIEEERRLFYVGATRAKQELYISVIKSRYDKPMKPSRFLTKQTEV